jgi:superfamily II DNA/RNA helicase
VPLTLALVSGVYKAIVFCRSKHGTDRMARQLNEGGVRAVAIHGDRTQRDRTKALADFMAGKVHVLVATDVAARGIHVDKVDLVVQADVPADGKDYQHRAGRTGRAGEIGRVVTLVPTDRRRLAQRIIDEAYIDAQLVTAPSLAAAREASVAAKGESPANTGRKANVSKWGPLGVSVHFGGERPSFEADEDGDVVASSDSEASIDESDTEASDTPVAGMDASADAERASRETDPDELDEDELDDDSEDDDELDDDDEDDELDDELDDDEPDAGSSDDVI